MSKPYSFAIRMSDETNQAFQDLPRSDHLDKIIDSLTMLITMQNERDEKSEEAFESLNSQLKMLQKQVRSPGGQQSEEEKIEAEIEAEIEASFKSTILAEYGLLGDETKTEPTAGDAPDTVAPASADSVAADSTTPANPDEHPVVEIEETRAIPPMDQEEINALKAELRQTLRDAEIELSIARAKLRQREASVDEREAQIARDAKLKMVVERENDSKPNGILDRLKLHLNGFAPSKPADGQTENVQPPASAESPESVD